MGVANDSCTVSCTGLHCPCTFAPTQKFHPTCLRLCTYILQMFNSVSFKLNCLKNFIMLVLAIAIKLLPILLLVTLYLLNY